MDEFISIIQFRTAVPFGYLLFLLFWLGTITWALTIFIRSLLARKFRDPTFYFSVSFLVLAIGYTYASIRYDENINMNPNFSESVLFGEWNYGDSILVFNPDGSAQINFNTDLQSRLGIGNGTGYWRRVGDFNLALSSNQKSLSSKSGSLRVIQYAKKYRLIIEDYDDPDMWDGSLGFKESNM